MALVLNDRVKETTITTGTGTLNLAGAATNFETFVAGIGNGNTVYYAIVHQDQPEFEVGLGTVTDASPDTLSRTTILSSSNSDGLVSFSAGTKDVFCTLPASKTVFEDGSGNVTLPGTLSTGGILKGSAASSTKTILNAKATQTELHTAGNDGLIFKGSGDNELARLDSSGNFLVGTTSSSLSSSSSATGINLNPNGASAFVRDGVLLCI